MISFFFIALLFINILGSFGLFNSLDIQVQLRRLTNQRIGRRDIHIFRASHLEDVEDNEGDEETASSLRGFERRALRAIAARLKRDDKLQMLSCKFRAESDFTDSYLNNLSDILKANELVQVKCLVDKKKEAKVLGSLLCKKLDAELAQTVGHSVLLYKRADPPMEISKLLAQEILHETEEEVMMK